MSDCFTLPDGLIVVETTVENNGIYGTGRPELPLLIVPLKVILRAPKTPRAALYFRELRCRVSPFDGAYIATSLPAWLGVCLSSGRELSNQTTLLEIQLDDRRISLIERLRRGGDVKLRLDCEAFVEELVELGQSEHGCPKEVFGLRYHHHLQAQIHVVVPRSVWIERVLPQTGFGQIHILELPGVPIERCAELRVAFEALQQAQKLEKQGFYTEAVGKCRIALEPFFEMADKADAKGDKRKVPVLKRSWEKRLGQATYDWLNTSLLTLKVPANQASHLSSTSFGQLEAQMLLIVTTALIAYAVKTQPEPPS
jgi:hypothetical protein